VIKEEFPKMCLAQHHTKGAPGLLCQVLVELELGRQTNGRTLDPLLLQGLDDIKYVAGVTGREAGVDGDDLSRSMPGDVAEVIPRQLQGILQGGLAGSL